MQSICGKIEMLSNIAVIICCTVFLAILVKDYGLDSHKQKRGDSTLLESSLVGKKLSIDNLDWAAHQQTLVLVLQKGCRFCDESMPLYRQLLTKGLSNQSKTHFVAIFPQSYNESKQYLKDNMIEMDDIRQASPRSIGVKSTPTLVLVDQTGTVLEQWVGKLSAAKQDAVLSRVEP